MTKSWWAYIPEVCEAGVVIDADTLPERTAGRTVDLPV